MLAMEYKYYIRPSGDAERVEVPDSLKTFARTRAAARGLSVVDETWEPRAVPPSTGIRAPKTHSGVPHKEKTKPRSAYSWKRLKGYSALIVAAATVLSLTVNAMQYFHPSTTVVVVSNGSGSTQQKAQPPPVHVAAEPNGNALNETSNIPNAPRDFVQGAYALTTAPVASAARPLRRARLYSRDQTAQFQVGRAKRALARLSPWLVMRPAAGGGWALSDVAMISLANIAKRNPLVELQVTPVEPCERRRTFFEFLNPFGDAPGECSEDQRAALEKDGQRFAQEIRAALGMERVANNIGIEPTLVTPISPQTNRLDASSPRMMITAVQPPAAIERYVVQQAIFHATSPEAEGGADGI
jgi:hypothetical protein